MMDEELKDFYIYTLKYKVVPIKQSVEFCEINKVWGYRIYSKRRGNKNGIGFFLKEKNK